MKKRTKQLVVLLAMLPVCILTLLFIVFNVYGLHIPALHSPAQDLQAQVSALQWEVYRKLQEWHGDELAEVDQPGLRSLASTYKELRRYLHGEVVGVRYKGVLYGVRIAPTKVTENVPDPVLLYCDGPLLDGNSMFTRLSGQQFHLPHQQVLAHLREEEGQPVNGEGRQ